MTRPTQIPCATPQLFLRKRLVGPVTSGNVVRQRSPLLVSTVLPYLSRNRHATLRRYPLTDSLPWPAAVLCARRLPAALGRRKDGIVTAPEAHGQLRQAAQERRSQEPQKRSCLLAHHRR